MPKTLKESRLHSNEHKPKLKDKQELNETQSNLPPNLQAFKQKFPSGSGFIEYKQFYKRDYLKVYQNIEYILWFF